MIFTKAKKVGATFDDFFTDDTKTTLKPNCASLILDAIWEIVNNQTAPITKKAHLTGLMTGCKTKLVMNFMIGQFSNDIS